MLVRGATGSGSGAGGNGRGRTGAGITGAATTYGIGSGCLRGLLRAPLLRDTVEFGVPFPNGV